MSRPVARFRPSRRYLIFSFIALLGAGVSAWAGSHWAEQGWHLVSYAVSLLFVITAGFITALVMRPLVEIHETYLLVGRREIAWNSISTVDQTSWVSPLTLRIGLEGGDTFLLVYPGEPDSAASLLRYVRRYARHSMLDGVPYRQFWGETAAHTRRESTPARYPLLRPEDEREIEQMFQRLKAAGRIDQHADEK